MENKEQFDVVILGGGPGGSTSAALLAQNGYRVAIIEKDSFPRFKIGESLLPYSIPILKASGVYSKISAGGYLPKYGAQFVDYRFSKEIYFEFAKDLSESCPHAFEVERAKFDQDLLDHAKDLGVEAFQPLTIQNLEFRPEKVLVETNEKLITGKYIIDASGQAAIVGRKLNMRIRNDSFNNVAVFSHFKDVSRKPAPRDGDIIIGILPNKCWSWTIPFKGNVSSVGVVFHASNRAHGNLDEKFLRQKLAEHPLLEQDMSQAEMLRPIKVASNYSSYNKEIIGDRWICIGDAAHFLDPVFSTGVHVSLMSAKYAAETLIQALKCGKLLNQTKKGSEYSEYLNVGVQRFNSLLRLFYDSDFVPSMKKVMSRPETLKAFTSVIGGDVWNDDNHLFQAGIL